MLFFVKRHPVLFSTLIVIVVLAIACKIYSGPTRTNVRVTAIDEGYEIRITTEGRHPIPISPEGPFPKWSRGLVLFVGGNGEPEEIGGVTFKKYTAGKDFDAAYWISWIAISEKSRRLILPQESYDNIMVERPDVRTLVEGARIQDIDEHYIRARGRFKGWNFEAAGQTFEVQNPPYNDPHEYEVVGFVRSNYFHTPGHSPYLFVISSKRIAK
jgi:hypothetical protein